MRMETLKGQSDESHHRCIDDNIGYVMLSEILRAQSHSILTLLRKESPDISSIKRLALKMHISTENLASDAGLVASGEQMRELFNNQSKEPASVQSIVEMTSVAAKHRLLELQLELQQPEAIPPELFVMGNPWELAYALFLILLKSGNNLKNTAPSHNQVKTTKSRKVCLSFVCENDFVDFIVPSFSPLSPFLDADRLGPLGSVRFSEAEWFCIQRLLAKNNAHIHIQKIPDGGFGEYGIVLRLPTFQPGHEEPLDFLKVVDLPKKKVEL
jgi:hypothetical protein